MRADHGRSRLREARERRGWSQDDLARKVNDLNYYRFRISTNVNKIMVSNWERGTKGISVRNQATMRALLDLDEGALQTPTAAEAAVQATANIPEPRPPVTAPSEAIGIFEETQRLLDQLGPAADVLKPRIADAWNEDLMRRRSLLKLIGGSAAAVTVAGPDPGHSFSRRPDSRDFDELAGRYQQLYHSASPGALLSPVVAHLSAIGDAIRSERTPRARAKLFANRSRVATLAGRLSFFDLNDPMAARSYYGLALEAAREADDHHQAVAALGHLAFIPAAEHSIASALDYLGQAKHHLAANPHGPLSSWVSAIESEFHTNTDDHTAALAAVDHAKTAIDAPGLSADLPWFDYFDANRLAGFAGYANLRAHRFDNAADELTLALDLPLSAVKQRAVFLTDLATVHYYAGDLDNACHVAMTATDELRRAGYATGADRLRDFGALVAPHRSTGAVRQFNDHAALLYASEGNRA